MARIPAQEVEKLKSEVSVVRLVESAGIALKKSGKDQLGLCPFHADGEPSLVVSPGKNLWHCFACQIGGGPIDWVMKRNGVSFRQAVELLRNDSDSSLAAGVEGSAPAPVAASRGGRPPVPVALDGAGSAVDDQALLNRVADFYHEAFRNDAAAQAYMASRGLADPALIAQFKIGYANRTLGLRLPAKTRQAGAEVRERLVRIGVYRASGHEHLTGALVVPVLDLAGNVLGMYGRKISANLAPGSARHLYLPGPHRGVWNEAGLFEQREVIMCEALFDAMTFWCAGFKHVTAAYGVEGFTADHMAALLRNKVARVLIAYDRDEAGDRGAAKLAGQLAEKGIECYRVLFPSGKDANGYAQSIKGGPEAVAQALGEVLRKALWLGKGEMLGLAGVDVAAPEAGAAPAPAAPAPAPASAPAPTPVYVSAPAPVPASPAPTLVAQVAPEIKGDDVHFNFGTGANARRYRVRGMGKNLAVAVLKINLMATCEAAFYVDTLDLYSAKQRGAFVLQACNELGVDTGLLKADLGKLLLALEQMQDEAIAKALNPAPVVPEMGEEARAAALAMLQAPDLVERIRGDMEAIGITGEATNKLVGYLAATSRMLNNPLAIVIRSSSAAGKTSLMDAVLAMMPEEERIKYSAMTGQSLFYMGQANLKHKILALAEEEGASRASYALKLLQSEGELTMASTGKDPVSGNLITQEYRVEGPVMLFTTTTALDIDPELLNRCLVLTVDESRAQTQAIHKLQRNKRTLQGLVLAQEKAAILALHQNAQRLLRPLAIMNPFADRLTFPDSATRMRRDHEKYLTLIDAIALLHQHQRPVKSVRCAAGEVDYIEVTAADIERANALAHDVLGRSLDDLPPQTRALLNGLCAWVASRAIAQGILRSEVRFARREAREALGLGEAQMRLHMDRLVEYEYLLPRRDGPGGRFVYELAYEIDGGAGRAYLPDLFDIAAENEGMNSNSRGYGPEVAGQMVELASNSRPVRGPFAGHSRGVEIGANAATARVSADPAEKTAKTHISKKNKKDVTHPQKDTYMQFGPENGPAINGAPVQPAAPVKA